MHSHPYCITHSFIMCVFCFSAASFRHKQKAADSCSHRSSVFFVLFVCFLLAAAVRRAAAANHVYQTLTLTLLICLLSVTLTAAKAFRVSSLSPDSIRMQTAGKSTKIKKKKVCLIVGVIKI